MVRGSPIDPYYVRTSFITTSLTHSFPTAHPSRCIPVMDKINSNTTALSTADKDSQPTAEYESSLNHDPTNPNEPADPNSAASKHPATGLQDPFFTNAAALSRLQAQASSYFQSHPGHINEACNTGFHNHLHAILAGKLIGPAATLTRIDTILSYRLRLCALATTLLDAAGIPRPEGKRRSDFSVDAFETRVYAGSMPLRATYDTALALCFSNVLPSPIKRSQGRRWNKPHRYIAAACACAATSGDANAPSVRQAVGMVEKGTHS